jgi:hypothetical protein
MTLIDSLMDFSCKRFARHVASGVDPLGGGPYRRLQFYIHWLICPFCKRYWKEIKEIGNIQRVNSAAPYQPTVRMADVKDRLKQKLIKRAS